MSIDAPIPVLFADGHLAVVAKPARLMAHESGRALGEQFMARTIEKTYLAVCRGWPDPVEDRIDHPLDGGPGKPEKKPAQTSYRVHLGVHRMLLHAQCLRFALPTNLSVR